MAQKQTQLRLKLKPVRARRRKKRFKRPAADSPQCQNMLRRRVLDGEHYLWLPSEQCGHHGWLYSVNGFQMALCICCARRMIRQTGCILRKIRA